MFLESGATYSQKYLRLPLSHSAQENLEGLQFEIKENLILIEPNYRQGIYSEAAKKFLSIAAAETSLPLVYQSQCGIDRDILNLYLRTIDIFGTVIKFSCLKS